MTVMKWLTPNEEWVNEQGVMPDHQADFPEYAYLAPLPRDKELKVGYRTTGDTFDQTTVSAVQAVQQKAELEVTGKVNAETAQAIEKAVTDQLKQEDHAYLKAVELLSK